MAAEVVVALLNLVCSLYLAGLIWTIQLAHYPAFRFVEADQFVSFERFHQARMTYIVAPAMIAEASASIALLVWRPAFVPLWLSIAGCVLVGCIWMSTVLVQVPLHARLSNGKDLESIELLIRTNWVRTVAWTVRGIAGVALLAAALNQ